MTTATENTMTIQKPVQKSSTRGSSPERFGSVLSTLLVPFARRFIAGLTLAEAMATLKKVKGMGFLTTLDHLGESVLRVEEAKIAADQYVVMLKALKENGLDRNVSLKLTQMGLAIDPALCLLNVRKIVAAAESFGGFVRIDMEGSDVTDATLGIVKEIKKTRGTPVGIVLQAMLRRTPNDVVDMLDRDITVRLCKGAYKEPDEVAFQDMRDIRQQYLSLAKRLITSGTLNAIATHDPYLIDEIKSFAKKVGLEKDQFEFQMLYGIRPSLQKELVKEGWKVRLYVPFGRAWLPYTWRRIRERKENLWFVVKSLVQW